MKWRRGSSRHHRYGSSGSGSDRHSAARRCARWPATASSSCRRAPRSSLIALQVLVGPMAAIQKSRCHGIEFSVQVTCMVGLLDWRRRARCSVTARPGSDETRICSDCSRSRPSWAFNRSLNSACGKVEYAGPGGPDRLRCHSGPSPCPRHRRIRPRQCAAPPCPPAHARHPVWPRR